MELMAPPIELDVEKLVQVIEQHPEGATVEYLEKALHAPRRTPQRRLAALVASGRARAVGPG
jgi:hypothetical protein